MENFAMLDIYVKKFPFKIEDNNIYPLERLEEINACSNEDVRLEKFYVWKLLGCGISKSIGKNIKDIDVHKIGSKWVSSECEFSISHTDNLVAVAIAKKPVGLDIEKIDVSRFKKIPPDKILTEEELSFEENKNPHSLNKLWTIKEGIFKKSSSTVFKPNSINTLNQKSVTKIVVDKDKEYFLSVVSDDCIFVKFHIDDNLKLKDIKP